MKRFSILAAALISTATLLGFGQASAQTVPHTPVTTPVNPGFFFWSIGVSGGRRYMPHWDYGQTFQIVDEVLAEGYNYDPKPWGAGPEFVMGYALNRGSLLGGVGDLPRIELALSTFFGTTRQTDTVSPDTDSYFLPFVDGTGGLFLEPTTSAKLHSTVYAGEAALRFKTAFRPTRRVQIVPSIAAIGGMGFYRYDWTANFRGVDTGDVNARVKETIRNWQAGAEAALQVKWQINGRWSVDGGAAIAAMYRHNSMRGLSHFNLSLPNTELINNTSDNKGTFVWRVGMTLGITYDWGWARVNISGFGYYDSAVPGIDNPTLNIDSGDVSAARLVTNGEWAYGGRIAIIFPLYRQRY